MVTKNDLINATFIVGGLLIYNMVFAQMTDKFIPSKV